MPCALLGDKALASLEAKVDQLPITITGDRATAPPLTGSGQGTSFLYRSGHWLIATGA